MKRREFVALIGGSAITWPFFSRARKSQILYRRNVSAS
jgi:hypothetical protein